MSVSDMFSGLGLESGESDSFLREASTTEGGYSNLSSHTERSGQRILDSADLATISSFDGESMSLNSESLQDFGSVVSLPAGTLMALLRGSVNNDEVSEDRSVISSSAPSSAEDGTRTILSSQPSGVFIPPPEASQDIWAVSPHPQFVAGRARSISTVGSDNLSYDNSLLNNAASETKEDSESDGSVVSIDVLRKRANGETGGLEVALPGQAISEAHHDSVSFEAVANHLMREATNNKGHWYENFTEQDWEQVRRLGKTFLATLQPQPPPSRSSALPPLPPTAGPLGYPLMLEQNISYSADDILPCSFVCSFCSDVVVGGLALDCSCPSSTVCTLCWEEHTQGNVSRDFSNQLGFVWVDRRVCPSCCAGVNGGVPCHALDVAILQIVQNLPTVDGATASLKQNYFTRLSRWGEEVVRRHEEKNKLQVLREDMLLAQLIQEEEHAFWDRQRKMEAVISSSTHTWLFFGQATVAVIAATMASFGLNALSRR